MNKNQANLFLSQEDLGCVPQYYVEIISNIVFFNTVENKK
jgi:hypothetical protein